MSAARRILKFLRAIAGEVGLVCPSGEQVTNGGFETGSLDPWTGTGDISSTNPRTGTYCCAISPSEYIEQSLVENVPQACFKVSSDFSFWYSRHKNASVGSTIQWRVTLTYDDASETVIDYNVSNVGCGNTAYGQIDLKGYVEAGKTLVGLRIECISATGVGFIFIDDVTCNV